jgi:hypothetical protein
MRKLALGGALLLVGMQWGCALPWLGLGGGSAAAPFVATPDMPDDQTKCKVAAAHENPLVTEWPAPEKANLEARLREGTVVVAYAGCTMRLLPQCRATGKYLWRRTTSASDRIEIHDADDLYAKLPLGAASLEGELKRSGRLAVQTTVAGQLDLEDFDPNSLSRDGSCLGATHVLGALSVGAFKLMSGGGASLRGGASTPFGNAGGESQREESLLREAGSPDKCDASTDAAADIGCASPIQVFLRPLPRLIADQGLPGFVKVRFLPVRGDSQWQIASGDRFLCGTPCERWMDPAMPVTFRKEKESVDVPDLRQYQDSNRMQVEARPTRRAQQLLGIVGTSLFGLAAVTGTALTSVGFGTDTSELKTAGLITLSAGVLGLVPSIWAIATSGPEVTITPWSTGSDPGSDRP